jgi:hypothetical protein
VVSKKEQELRLGTLDMLSCGRWYWGRRTGTPLRM